MPSVVQTSYYSALDGMYRLEETIGSGGFAKVKRAIHLPTLEPVAIKIMDKKSLGVDLPRVYQEISAMKELNHQHIAKLLQVIESETKLFLVIEYCPGGELFDYIVERDRLTEAEARIFFRQIVSAVAYIHHNGYAHRDLKPENLLLNEDRELKLIDFGLCAHPSSGLGSQLSTCCGSPAYAAPELVGGCQYLGAQADVWSMGVLLYALLCGFLPFDDENLGVLYQKIQAGAYTKPDWLSASSLQLLEQMLRVDPRKRIKVADLISHPWLIGTYSLPVEWKSYYQCDQLDSNILTELSVYLARDRDEVARTLLLWNYEHAATATYWLMLAAKRRGEPIRLRPHRSNDMYLGVHSSSKQQQQQMLLSTSPQGRPWSLDTGLDEIGSARHTYEQYDYSPYKPSAAAVQQKLVFTADEAHSDTIHTSSDVTVSSSSIQNYNTDENFVHPASTYKPSHRSRRPTVADSCVSPDVGGKTNSTKKTPQRRIRPQSENFRSPTTVSARKQGDVTPRTPLSGRKMFGSIEKGLDRVRNILTPRRRGGYSRNLEDGPCVIDSKKMLNVSSTGRTDANQVLIDLRRELWSRGVQLKQKGYTLRGKLTDNNGKVCSTFELEVCIIANLNLVGIRRKRLEGDAWCYKRVCEQILRLSTCER